jgi:hypothetical protein
MKLGQTQFKSKRKNGFVHKNHSHILRYSRPSRDSRLKIFASNVCFREMPNFFRGWLDLRKACYPCCDFGFPAFRSFVMPPSNGLLRVPCFGVCIKKGETGSRRKSTLLRFCRSNEGDFSPPFHESKPIRSRGSNPVIFLFFARIGSEVVVVQGVASKRIFAFFGDFRATKKGQIWISQTTLLATCRFTASFREVGYASA